MQGRLALFFAVIAFSSLVKAADRAPAAESVQPQSAPSTSVAPTSSNAASNVQTAIDEFTRSRDMDLENYCRVQNHCSYDWKTHVTTCPPETPAHTKKRCEVILWASAVADNVQYEGCSQFFVDKDNAGVNKGNLGRMGRVILDEIVENMKENGEQSPFLQNNSNYLATADDAGKIQSLCPGYNSFDDVERAEFHLYLMENLAYRELSCSDKNISIQGPSDQTTCMFQLEASETVRHANHRPAACFPKVGEPAISAPETCGRCAVEMMAGELQTPTVQTPGRLRWLPNKPFGTMAKGRITHGSYWFALNPDTPEFLRQWQKRHTDPKTHKMRLTPHQGLVNDLKYFPRCQTTSAQ